MTRLHMQWNLRTVLPAHGAAAARQHVCPVPPSWRRNPHNKTVCCFSHPAIEELAAAQPINLHMPQKQLVAELNGAPALHTWHSRPELLQGCEPGAAPLKVAVLLSGGVDSSLALHLLKAAGHNVTAFYLKIWFQDDFENFWSQCPWEEDLQYCQQVCDAAGVPLEVVPLTEQYWDRVVAHSISEIRAGRTPNPDVLCNSRVKFGAFFEHLTSRQHEQQFDRIASGHYARLLRHPDPEQPVELALSPDAVKDQTYFLAHLTQQQLARVLLPLGVLTKAEARQLAAAADLPNKARRDSQGICFLGKVKFTEFVQQHLGTWPGPLVEAETDRVVGYHEGYWFHTLGQRKGIHLSGGPWYVVRKDIRHNVVYVSNQYYDGHLLRKTFHCKDFNWINSPPSEFGGPVRCKVRHGPVLNQCTLELNSGGTCGIVNLPDNDQGLAAGQYAAFYQDGIALGSAVIDDLSITATLTTERTTMNN